MKSISSFALQEVVGSDVSLPKTIFTMHSRASLTACPTIILALLCSGAGTQIHSWLQFQAKEMDIHLCPADFSEFITLSARQRSMCLGLHGKNFLVLNAFLVKNKTIHKIASGLESKLILLIGLLQSEESSGRQDKGKAV